MPRILSPVDLNKGELRQAATHNLAAAPGSPSTAQRYYDTALKRERYWNGTTWVDDQGKMYHQSQPTNYTTNASGIIFFVFAISFLSADVAVMVANNTPNYGAMLSIDYRFVTKDGFQVMFHNINGPVLNTGGIALSYLASGWRP